MSFTKKAQTIMDRGLAAFRKMRVRPEKGHTDVVSRSNAPFKWTCVVGALAYEAKTLQLLKETPTDADGDSSDELWVQALFGVDEQEVGYLEQGFDGFFDRYERGGKEEQERFEKEELSSTNEMFQVGWHVARKATSMYQDLDASEEEAWKRHHELGLKDKTWVDVKMMKFRLRLDDESEQFLKDCEGDPECEEMRRLVYS